MRFVRKIKDLLPPSSRSFHQFRKLEADRFDYLVRELEQSYGQIEALLNSQAKTLNNNLEVHDTHMKMLAWDACRKPNETVLQAKKRFFKEIPPATGSSRLVQLGCTQLLRAFNKLCSEHNLRYWAGGGTLIGAIRHNGFIPWDDDVDLCMPRCDLERLAETLRNSKDYRLSVVYDPFVLCCQYRFVFRDENIPCFLDIFPFDFSNDKKGKEKVFQVREELKQNLISCAVYEEWIGEGCVENGHPLSSQIQTVFSASLNSCTDRGLTARDGGIYFVRGIDNFDDPNGYHWSSRVDEVFPLKWIAFENTEIAIPSNHETLLSGAYGDIFELPKDIHSHFDHIAGAISDQQETDSAIRAKLDEG